MATAQTLSGTGALRLGAEFMKKFAQGKTVYISNPTWGTHNSIMTQAPLERPHTTPSQHAPGSAVDTLIFLQ